VSTWKPSSADKAPPSRSIVTAAAAAQAVVRYVWAHPANEGKRVQALCRAARYQAEGRLLHRRSIARLGERSRLWVDLHRTGASMVMYANPPDVPEMMLWRRVLKPGELFVDIGANVGSYTIWAAELGADVIAVEPADDTFALLVENIELNGYRVRAVQAAAASSCGTGRFTAGRDATNCLDANGPVQTRLVTVDSLIDGRTVAGLKVDVEGFEIEVLRGCTRALSERRIRLIQLEWNMASLWAVGADRRQIADLLVGYGYELCRPGPGGRLVPVTDLDFGADVFARPSTRENGDSA
jgi:FkbM family methyltransferase